MYFIHPFIHSFSRKCLSTINLLLQHYDDEEFFQIAVSLDENIIDFESRKVKERRAHDELSTGKYRHPNFIASKMK